MGASEGKRDHLTTTFKAFVQSQDQAEKGRDAGLDGCWHDQHPPSSAPLNSPWASSGIPSVRSDHTLLQPGTGAVPGTRSAHSLSSKKIKLPSRQL